MPGIETRVVQVKFDNTQFEAAIRQTLASLAKLNTGLNLEGATKGLSNINQAAGKVDVNPIAAGVDRVSSRFSAMSVVAVTALATVANKAVTTGATLAKSMTLDPMIKGFQEYETNMNSIQTILANTQAAGTNLKQVNATLDELNHYSDQTIYNFAEMAKNIGTFTAAGVDLETATSSIKGIANLAALSGSNSEQAAGAMYQLSQAISAGKVSLEDWNSVVNAGMGGTVFQRALAQNAEKLGTLDKGAVKLKGSMKNVTIEGKSFRESITALPGQDMWLTSEVLTQTLAQFTGDLSDAELAAQGFSQVQIEEIQKQAATARNAATEVKTLTGLMSTLKESSGSGWSATWRLIIGDFEQAKALFTDVNNVIGGFVSKSAEARNKVIGDWNKLGGRTVMIEAISNAFHALMDVVRPIGEAFRDIFPATTGQQLYDLSVSLRDFTETLTVSSETADRIKRTFKGVFAVFGIGVEIIKQIGKAFFGLFDSARQGSGGFLEITASIGDFLVSVHEALVEGEGIARFFEGLTKILSYPINALKALGGLIADLFTGGGEGSANLEKRFSPLASLGDAIATAWERAVGVLEGVWAKFQSFAPEISAAFSDLMGAITEAFSSGNYDQILDGINTGLFAGLVAAFHRFANGSFLGGILDEGFVEKISESFDTLTGTMQAMQTQLKASALLKIAGAIGILTVSVVALSMIDSAKLTSALTALTVMFTQLGAGMLAFQTILGGAGLLQLPFMAAGLILLATAIGVLTVSVKSLSELSWEDLAKGLSGVVVLLAALVGTVKLMSGQSAGMIKAGAGLLVLSLGIKVLASAVTDLAGLSWEDMTRGLLGVGALLGALGLFVKFAGVDKGGVLTGAGILLLAAGIKVLASALIDIASLSWEELAKGLVGMAAGLTLMGTALLLIPPSSILSAAAVLVAATALNLLAVALGKMAEMSWEEIAKSLVLLAGSLGLIAAAMIVMTTALPGAAALLVVSAALAIFTPVLLTLGSMSWVEIAKGLITLAGALTIIGVAGIVLTPVVPTLIGLGGAVGLLGAGMLAAGVGVLAFSVAMTTLAAAGVAGAKAIVEVVKVLAGAIPVILTEIARGIGAFAKEIGKAAPSIVNAARKFIMSFLNALEQVIPKIIQTLIKMIDSLLSQLANALPRMISSGVKIIMAILQGISQNIGKIIDVASKIIVNFLNGISRNLPKITEAGVRLIITFVNSMANSIRGNQAAMNSAGSNLAGAIIDGMISGLRAGIGRVGDMARSVADNALSAAKGALGIASPSKEFRKVGEFVIEGFVQGMQGGRADIRASFDELKTQLKATYKAAGEDVKRLEARLKTLTSRRKKDHKAIRNTMYELAQVRAEQHRSGKAYDYLTKKTLTQRKALSNYAKQQELVTAKLDAANKTLADTKKTRDDYNKSVRDQYSDLPEIAADVKLEDYLNTMRKQIVETKAYAAMLQKLRKLGLNDTMYKELLAKGPEAIPFVSQLLDSGKRGVDEINNLGKTLDSTAAGLGKTASANLYQAAVDSAQGLVDGLKKQQKNIDAQMAKIANSMVNAIKRQLGIKSPSREFMKVGSFSGQGLAKGLLTSSGVVQKASDEVGKQAILAMQKSISQIDKMGATDLDLQPHIRPVVDLTDVKRGAGEISSLMTANKSISVGATYDQARAVRRGYEANAETTTGTTAVAAAASKSVVFNQYNNSPKALSPIELYRQTNNQISQAKGALTK